MESIDDGMWLIGMAAVYLTYIVVRWLRCPKDDDAGTWMDEHHRDEIP